MTATVTNDNLPAHTAESCKLCATKARWHSSNSHKKVPPEGLEPFVEELLLIHIPNKFRCCADCHQTWPCATNKILHAELKRRRDSE